VAVSFCLGNDLDAELDIIREAFLEIVGERAMAASKAASTLPQDGRSEVTRVFVKTLPADEPTLTRVYVKTLPYDAGEIPPELQEDSLADKRKPQTVRRGPGLIFPTDIERKLRERCNRARGRAQEKLD
jgi:hypothetical protein